MNKKFSFLQIVKLFSLFFTITFIDSALAQNYWERTSGPGTVIVYDFLFKDDFILIGTWIGGMYKSTDEGESWQHLENEFSHSSVYALKLLSNGNILAGTGSGIHISSDNGETWFYSALPDYLVSTINVDESDSIYIGSYYSEDIYRSVDNGINWNPLNSGISYIRSIVTKAPSTIIVASGEGTYKSSDKGITWEQTLSPIKMIADLALNQSGSFSAISDFGDFYLSTDEGVTWDSISTISSSSRIIFSSNNGDLYLGSYGVYRSTDEGHSWNQLNGFQGSGLVRSIAESGNSFYAGTYFSGVYRSNDAGNNWSQSSRGINYSSVSILKNDFNGKVYAVSLTAGLSVTSDNGENWEILGAMSSFNSLSASPNGSIFGSYGSAFSGFILRSTDAGVNWEIIYENDDTTVSQVNVNIDASVYAIIAHQMFKSTNNGDDWLHIQISDPYEYINSVTFNHIGYIFVRSSLGYVRSSDNGETWIELTSTPQGLEIFGISKSDKMYATASDSGYYKSNDYGDSWIYLSKGNGKQIRSFTSNDIGYLFILEQFHNIRRSTDDGISWQEINSGLDSVSINCLAITDEDYLLAGSSRNGVYRSVNKTTSIENSFIKLPNSLFLEQNYPNPFNPSTKIQYQVVGNSYVNLKIYDVLGNEVETLVSEEKPTGFYEVEFDGSSLSSGIYFYQLRAGNFVETRKMILLR